MAPPMNSAKNLALISASQISGKEPGSGMRPAAEGFGPLAAAL